MPMPHTDTYLQRLGELHHKAPNVARLTARIAAVIQPERQSLSPDDLESVLFIHADAIAQKIPSCTTRLTAWLKLLAADEVKAIEHCDVVTFANEAVTLGGPSGVLAVK